MLAQALNQELDAIEESVVDGRSAQVDTGHKFVRIRLQSFSLSRSLSEPRSEGSIC